MVKQGLITGSGHGQGTRAMWRCLLDRFPVRGMMQTMNRRIGPVVFVTVLGFMFACPGTGLAQTFLILHPGADHAAMAGANTALAWDADAPFYNPAGTALLPGINAAFGINPVQWFDKTGFWNGAGTWAFRPGLSVGAFADGVWQPYVHTSPIWGRLSEGEFGLNAAWAPFDWLSAGVNAKHLGTFIAIDDSDLGVHVRDNAWAVAADFGLLVRHSTRIGQFRAGGSAQNLGTKMQWTDPVYVDDVLPRTVRAGAAWVLRAADVASGLGFGQQASDLFGEDWLQDNWRFCLAYDYTTYGNLRFYPQPEHSVGAELRPVPFLVLRGGWFYSGEGSEYEVRKGLTWGLGLDLRYVRFDVCDDDVMYYRQPQEKWLKWSVSVNIGQPLFHM